MAQKKWKFIPAKDRVITTTSAVASLGALGAGLSLAFNPVAIGVAAGIAGITLLQSQLLAIPAFRKSVIDGAVKKGSWVPVSKDALASKLTAEISEQLGRPKPPELFTVDSKTVAKMALPFGLRWLFKPMESKAMPTVFAAVPGANLFITTKEALNNGMTEAQLRFVASHEMSHLHAKDNRSPSLMGGVAVKKVSRVLFWATLGATALSVAGVATPVLLGSGLLAGLAGLGVVAGTNIVAKALNNFGMRAVEQRADRNGVYITRDLGNAKSALAHIDPPKKKTSYVMEALLDHPSYNRRAKILAKAFEKVSRLPKLPSASDVAAAVKPTVQKAANTL